MTVLPSRATLTDFSSTQGQVRTAIGDLRDFVFEALGSSGVTAVLNNPIIKASSSAGFGAGMNSPSTTIQINGNFSITPNASPAPDPGNGAAYIYQNVQFASIHAAKLLLTPSLNHSIGSQDQTVYFRTNNYFAWYTGGTFTAPGLNAGTGGTMIAHMNAAGFFFMGQDVYTKAIHGQLPGENRVNTFAQFNTFTGGLRVNHQPLRIGQAGVSNVPMTFDYPGTGYKILFYNGDESYSQGVQPSTFYVRTAYAFTIYQGGAFSNAFRNGGGGVEILHVDPGSFLYKGARVHTDAVNGHGNFIDADTVDGIHGSSIVTKLSGSRPGAHQLFIANQDTPHQIFFQYDGARMRWYSNQWQTGQGFETAVNYSDTAGNSLNCSGTSVYAQNANPVGNIAVCSFSNQNRHGSVTNLSHALADDGIDMQMHHDNGYMRLLTTSGHPTRVARSDSSNYADNAGTVSAGLGINSLHKAQGSARVVAMSLDWTGAYYAFGVHQYSFGSPLLADMVNTGGGSAGRIAFTVPTCPITGSHRNWSIFYSAASANSANFATTAVWDYLTASGNPEVWVSSDPKTGKIISTWEAEDPLNPDDTDILPLTADGQLIQRVKMPTINYVMPLITKLMNDIKAPDWFQKSRYGELNMSPEDILLHLISEQYKDREWGFDYNPEALNGLKSLPGIIYDSPKDTDKTKDWKVQLLLRQVQRVALNNPALSMTRLITENFKLQDTKKPLLVLK